MNEAPGPWPYRRLGDLVEILDSRRIPVSASERAARPGVVPYYGATGRVGTIDQSLFNEPLLLLGEDGVQFFDPSKPKAYRISGPSWVNNHAHVLRARTAADQTFLEHYLNHFDYRGYANGTTRLKLTQVAMRSIPVPVPALEEQRRIVAILEEHLTSLDVAELSLESTENRLSALETSWLHRWLNAINMEPQRLGSVLTDMRGGWSRSARHLVAASDGVPYIKMNNITSRGSLDLSGLVFVADTGCDSWEKYGVRHGDVLFNSKNSSELVGKTALADTSVDGALLNENIMRLRFDQAVDPAFAWTWFQGPAMKAAIAEATRASTGVAAIYQHRLTEMPIVIPDIEVQREVAGGFLEVRDSVDRLTAVIAGIRSRNRTLRRSLLAAAFSGRLTGRASDSDVIDTIADQEAS